MSVETAVAPPAGAADAAGSADDVGHPSNGHVGHHHHHPPPALRAKFGKKPRPPELKVRCSLRPHFVPTDKN